MTGKRKNSIASNEAANTCVLTAEMDSIRLVLAEGINRHNHGVLSTELNLATTCALESLLLWRVLEKRRLQPVNGLLKTIESWKSNKKRSLTKVVRSKACRMSKGCGGGVFDAFLTNGLAIDSKTLFHVIQAMCSARMEHQLQGMSVWRIAQLHAHFVGKSVKRSRRGVLLVPTPEKRKAHGIFCTPEWLAEYVVKRALGPKLNTASAQHVSGLKTLDLACGCGTLTVELAKLLFRFWEKYYSRYPRRIRCCDNGIRDAYKLKNGEMRLSHRKKAEIVTNCIFGIDLDP